MFRWFAGATTVRRGSLAAALLGGGLFAVGCSADHALAPHQEQQDGFTVTFSGPFVVDHLQRVTIRHASDGHRYTRRHGVESIVLSNADRFLAKVRDAAGSRFVILTPANVE